MALRLNLTTKGVLLVVALVIGAVAAVAAMVDQRVRGAIQGFVTEDQAQTLRIAARLLEESYPEFRIRYDDAGDVARITVERMPTFESHGFVDRIGEMTRATATVFVWDDASRDFWRKTTNIEKDDGTRAVGTALGQDGRVYPVVTAGETYQGEATILGTDYYTVYEPISDGAGRTVGILYAGIEQDRMTGMLARVRSGIVQAALVAVVIGAVAAACAMRFGVRPLVRVIAVVRRVGTGETGLTIPHTGRTDEIGELARALETFQNAMVASEAQRAQLRRMAAAIDELARSTVGQVDRQARSMTERLDGLSASADQLSASAGEVDTAAGEADGNIRTVAAASEELTASIQEIARQVQQSSNVARDAVARTEASQEVVAKLSDLGERIGDIVSLIGRIAEQTNLLALNATIESSRAGEAGRGFAVVAGEVKALAQQTGQSTKEIEARVGEIRAAARAAAAAVAGVGETIKSMDEITTSVAGAVEEQRAATEEIARGVRQSSDANAQVAQEIKRVAGESRATTEAASALKGESGGLLESVRALGEETSRLVHGTGGAGDPDAQVA